MRESVSLGILLAASGIIESVMMCRLHLFDRSLPRNPCIVWMGTKALNCNNASTLVNSDAWAYKELLVLLYFGFVMIVLTADPNVEACGLDSGFAAHYRSGLIHVALRH